ncbi:MAG: hypothetical protein MJB14_23045 [Spirochaetes bacterium]|nr:hypothetical protein [Spirochaetota bacterium]
MSLFSLFKKKKISENDFFISIIQIAEEDSLTSKIIRQIILLSADERHKYINEVIASLKTQKAPAELIEGIMYLQDDAISQKVYTYLKNKKLI